jgi:hypothetical protein
MFKKAILWSYIVLALFTYKFPILVPLSLILVAFSFYHMHRILLMNKDIIDRNTDDVNRSITSLLNNQKTIQSDLRKLKSYTEKNGKKSDNKN